MYFPLIAVTSEILNGYFFSGMIFTVDFILSPEKPRRVARFGTMVTKFSTLPETVRRSTGWSGELVLTRIVLVSVLPP